MKKYNATIKFIAPYLQARFSEKAKEELLQDARKTILKNVTEEDEQWVRLSYFDDNGYYIPATQIRGSLIESSKDFKMKARKTSLAQWTKASLFIDKDRLYIGKEQPDEKLTSYPPRKTDKNRVRVIHPMFHAGLEVQFPITVLDKDFAEKTLKEIIENAGRRCGLGARRPEYGRFELLSLEAV